MSSFRKASLRAGLGLDRIDADLGERYGKWREGRQGDLINLSKVEGCRFVSETYRWHCLKSKHYLLVAACFLASYLTSLVLLPLLERGREYQNLLHEINWRGQVLGQPRK